jgi:hypothetical protein
VLPGPPSVEVTTLVVLVLVPDVVPVVVTLKEQLVFEVREPPEKVSKLPPVITRLPVPHKEFVVPLGAVKPAGKVSVKPMPLKELARLGLEIVKDNVDVLPVKIESGEKDLAITGGAITVRGAVA